MAQQLSGKERGTVNVMLIHSIEKFKGGCGTSRCATPSLESYGFTPLTILPPLNILVFYVLYKTV